MLSFVVLEIQINDHLDTQNTELLEESNLLLGSLSECAGMQ